MITLTLWKWWYQYGWLAAARAFLYMLYGTLQNFSVPVLVRTLFAPWKQTVNTAGPNTPLPVRIRWWVGNQVSRFIGAAIRIIVLISAVILLAIMAVSGGVLLLLWPFAPVAVVGGLVMAVVQLWI